MRHIEVEHEVLFPALALRFDAAALAEMAQQFESACAKLTLLEEAKAAEQLFRVRFAKSLGKQEGLKNLRSLKLDIARIKTIARERKSAAAAGKE